MTPNSPVQPSKPQARPSPQWSEQRMRAAYQGLLVKRRRRQATKRAALVAALLLVVAGVGFGLRARFEVDEQPSPQLVQVPKAPDPATPDAPAPSEAPAPEPAPETLRLKDGSRALALKAKTQLILIEDSSDRLRLGLEAGAARFEVEPQTPGRSFEVDAGVALVQVIGTIFEVEHQEGGVVVRVIEGTVRVNHHERQRVLRAGDVATFEALAALKPVEPAPPKEVKLRAGQGGKPAREWLSLAKAGSFEQAAQHVEQSPWAVKNSPEELMLAADALRYTGKHQAALGYLERVERDHAKDPRASRAAFTRGLILLKNLAKPKQAAAAFAAARAHAPKSALAQDALAREVEALARAQEKTLAQARAREYLRLYPEGHRLEAVRHFGQLP